MNLRVGYPKIAYRSLPRLLFGILVVLSATASIQPIHAQEKLDGRVTGVVTNGTTGKSVGDAQVTLSRFESVGPESVDVVTSTDSDGRFTFEGLDSSDGYVFAASFRYQRVLYSTGMIQLSQTAQQEVEIVVYEATTDDSAITIQARGIVVSSVDVEEGIVTITDLSVIANQSNMTFTGDDDGRTIRFHVPGNTIQVTPRGGFDFTNAMIEDATVFTIAPLRPGDVDATLDYTVPYTGKSVSFPIESSYPTDLVRILVPTTDSFADVTLNANGRIVDDEGVVGIEDSQYHVWTVANVGAGESVDVTISNLPETGVAHNELQPLIPGIVAISILAVAAGLTGAVVMRRGLYKQRPVTLSPPASATLDERRTDLADQLRSLEARWSADDVDENEYRVARIAILENLRKISRQARGLGDDE